MTFTRKANTGKGTQLCQIFVLFLFFLFLPSFLPSLLSSFFPFFQFWDPSPHLPSSPASFFSASGNNILQDDVTHYYPKAWEWFVPMVSLRVNTLEALLLFS